MSKKTQRTDYDSPWKGIIEQFFEEFMEFFFPDIHTGIAWATGYEFLDKELQKIIRDSKTNNQRVDKLVKVWRKNGEEAWVAIHIEIQSQRQTHFNQRMFQYHTQLYNHYQKQIVSLAILSDNHPNWRPNNFSYDLWGCKIRLDFPIVKLLDYQQDWAELEQSLNPFAVVVAAHLETQKTKPASTQRKDAKFQIIRRLYERGYSRRQVLELFRFIDWIMILTPELEANFQSEMMQYEEEQKMQYISNIERRWMKEGLEKGLEKGLEQGIEQGVEQSTREAIIEVLLLRFNEIPANVMHQLKNKKDISWLKEMRKQAIIASSIEVFTSCVLEA